MSQPMSNQHPSTTYPPQFAPPSAAAKFETFPEASEARPPPPQHIGPPQPTQFYPQYLPPNSGDPNSPARYALSHPTENRSISNKQKKEIKRRTKTGCLTCRKRRIKCDEGHPSCRNCQKSKRECLGYDPIFKPQSSGTAGSTASQTYHPPPQTTANTYSARLPKTYPLSGYGLSTADEEEPESESDLEVDEDGNEDGQVGNSDEPSRVNTMEKDGSKAYKIQDLLCLNGISPPPPASEAPLSDKLKNDIRLVYGNAYAPGLDKFLETRWFSTRGLAQLLANTVLVDQFAMLLTRYTMNPQDPNYHAQHAVTQSLEAIVIWSMLAMCKKVATTRDPETGAIAEDEMKERVEEAAHRLDCFEALVTGKLITADTPLTEGESQSNGSTLQGQLKSRAHEFWQSVATFVTIENNSPEAASKVEEVITKCRALLESRENRDVIYSMMVARHYGAQIPGFPENLPPPETNDERDVRAKVAVAKKLVEDEANGRGTNQVIQRLCGMATRGWALRR